MTKKEAHWEPGDGQEYWFVTHTLQPFRAFNDEAPHDPPTIRSGNCFRTEAEAVEAGIRIRQALLDYHKELAEADA